MFKIGKRAIHQKNIESAISEAVENGFEVLEIHLSSPQFMPESYSAERIVKIKGIAQKYNIILQIHAPLEHSLVFMNKELRQASFRQLEQMVCFSKEIGARCLTLHPGRTAIYNSADGSKLKNDDLYPEFYKKLFENSVKNIISIAPKSLFICIENTDNFTPEYQKILDKYLKTGRLFLTWDIRKTYTYDTDELIKKQWVFVKRNKRYVKNLHVSGFDSAHGSLRSCEGKIIPFLKLFNNKGLPIIIEIMPLTQTIKAKKILERMFTKNGR